MSAVSNRLGRLEGKVELYMKDGKFYEAEQIYSTICSRLSGTGDHNLAADVADSGATRLLAKQSPNAGTKLAMQMLDYFTRGQRPLDTGTRDIVLNLFRLFSEENAAAKIAFMKAAIKWSIQSGSSVLGDPLLHLELARYFQSTSEFGYSNYHFLKSLSPQEHYDMLSEWLTLVYPSERDLLLARTVLQYLALENIDNAKKIFDLFKSNGDIANELDTPIVNFIRFLLETVRRDAVPLFQMLRSKYASALQRDASFNTYLDHIGMIFFNIQPPQSGGLLSGLLSSLGDS